MKNFYDLSLEDITLWAKEKQLPAFRAKQIYAWQAKGIEAYAEMSNISKAIREDLEQDFFPGGLKCLERLVSQKDETKKYVFKLRDENMIETVLMKYKHGYSVCLSSQAGCRMGCHFCASTQAGFGRNLSHGEMYAQLAQIAKMEKIRISNIVIMGIGEPLENLSELILLMKKCNEKEGLSIGLRHITVSTCGIIPKMVKFANMGMPVTLSVSLHAPNQKIREKLMPIAKTFDYDELIETCHRYVKQTGRRITFEYILFYGVNDQPVHAQELLRKLEGLFCHINLIPFNAVAGSDYKRSTSDDIKRFKYILEKAGMQVTLRRELGSDILAACGQLRRNHLTCKKS